LKKHIRTIHKVSECYSCTECSYTASDRSILDIHTKDAHHKEEHHQSGSSQGSFTLGQTDVSTHESCQSAHLEQTENTQTSRDIPHHRLTSEISEQCHTDERLESFSESVLEDSPTSCQKEAKKISRTFGRGIHSLSDLEESNCECDLPCSYIHSDIERKQSPALTPTLKSINDGCCNLVAEKHRNITNHCDLIVKTSGPCVDNIKAELINDGLDQDNCLRMSPPPFAYSQDLDYLHTSDLPYLSPSRASDQVSVKQECDADENLFQSCVSANILKCEENDRHDNQCIV
jgi:hypothetical protein